MIIFIKGITNSYSMLASSTVAKSTFSLTSQEPAYVCNHSDKFMQQIKRCAEITQCKYPLNDGYRVVWVFDHSKLPWSLCGRCHKMNAKPKGYLWGILFGIEKCKKWCIILEFQRGRYRHRIKLDEMRAEIGTQILRKHFLNSKGYIFAKISQQTESNREVLGASKTIHKIRIAIIQSQN